MLSSEMHSPEKLASRPPAIKISGNIPVDSDARGIVPRALSPAERPGCCSDFIYSESWSSRHCHSALVLGRAALGGTRAPPAPPHVCTHGVQPSSAPVLMPSPETQAKGPLRLACAAADGDGAVLCPATSQPQEGLQDSGFLSLGTVNYLQKVLKKRLRKSRLMQDTSVLGMFRGAQVEQ